MHIYQCPTWKFLYKDGDERAENFKLMLNIYMAFNQMDLFCKKKKQTESNNLHSKTQEQ